MEIGLRRKLLHQGIVDTLVYRGYVAAFSASDLSGDIAQPLDWPGKTVVFEVLASEASGSGRSVSIDAALLKLHAEAPIPVYFIVDVSDWYSDCDDPQGPLDALGFERTYIGHVVGVCSARSMAQSAAGESSGQVTVALSELALMDWHEFLKALISQSPAKAPPARIASCTPLDNGLLDDPEIASKIVTEQTDPRVREHFREEGSDIVIPLAHDLAGPVASELHEYVAQGDGFAQPESGGLKDELRRYVHDVEAASAGRGDGVIVMTLPWQCQLPMSAASREQLLRAMFWHPVARMTLHSTIGSAPRE